MSESKIKGTKPPRKTLGQALADLRDQADNDLKKLIPVDSELDENVAASIAFGAIDYDAQSLNEPALPRRPATPGGSSGPYHTDIEQGNSDISSTAIKALSAIASDASKVNDLRLPTIPADSTGGRRGEVLGDSFQEGDGGVSFRELVELANPDANVAFDKSSGGAGATHFVDGETVGKSGGFYTSEEIEIKLAHIPTRSVPAIAY